MLTICVLFGGVSSEHDVSLLSAASVLRNIDTDRYHVIMVGITKDGRWLRYRGEVDAISAGEWQSGDVCPCVLSPDRSHKGLLEFGSNGVKTIPVDVVFPVLHGKNGEDGTMQGLLELSDIPYVGCGVLAGAACMDKDVCHTMLVAAGVPKTKLIALTRPDTADFTALERRLAAELGYPMFVKPANAGSSVGISKVKDACSLRDAISLAFNRDSKIVVEQMLAGKEIECAVIGNSSPAAAYVLGEIAPKNEFYDYEGKYLDGSTDLYVPARIDEPIAQRVRELAVKAYKAMGCTGLSRVDFFVDGEQITLNEINTLPGFTSISMYPRLFGESGLSYDKLIDRLIDCALESKGGVHLG